MPSSVHKVLIHGPEIALNFNIGLAYMGEEAGESRNKVYKRIREGHTDKSSRYNTQRDLMNRSLETTFNKTTAQHI